MPNPSIKLCIQCKKRRVPDNETICAGCRYANLYHDMSQQEPDNQDWEFAYCEECGSSLDSQGVCRNQNCGNSPDVGKDWY